MGDRSPMQSPATPAFFTLAALAALAGACASPGATTTTTTAVPIAAQVDPLAGCRLQPGPAALCDDGRVLIDVATVPGGPADRIVAIHGTTDRPDAPFQLEPGTAQTTADGDVVRVDVVRPYLMPQVAVGTVTFLAPAAGQSVMSCAAFDDAGAGRCIERARALLVAQIPETASLQHRPTIALPPDPDCTGTDADFAQQRLCSGDVKLSIVGIRGRFGPAAAWWMWHRIVQAQAQSLHLVTACPVLGAFGPCAVVDLGGRIGLFGAHVARDELQVAACISPPTDTGFPRPCFAAFNREVSALTERHVTVLDLPGGCTLTQASRDTWSRQIECDGITMAQFATASEADAFVAAHTTAPPSSVGCVVAGARVPCTMAVSDGVTVWRAEVKGPVVNALVCAAPTSSLPPLCASFIELTP
jgi:hypothetical protein